METPYWRSPVVHIYVAKGMPLWSRKREALSRDKGLMRMKGEVAVICGLILRVESACLALHLNIGSNLHLEFINTYILAHILDNM